MNDDAMLAAFMAKIGGRITVPEYISTAEENFY